MGSAEDTDVDVADGDPRRGWAHNQTACEGEGSGGGGVNWFFLAIGDSSPPNTLLKQEGLQLAEASFRDMGIGLNGSSFEI